jgi:pimeloyl-ACP methyl ester carboxylesterase
MPENRFRVRTFKILSFIALLFVIDALPCFSQHSDSLTLNGLIADKYAAVDGRKMHYQIEGSGAATVVFENGFWDNLHTWDNIYSEVAKFAKVFRYDRFGNGTSDTTNVPRTFEQIERELHSLLQEADVKPPYILVGHSMGGALIRAFAFLYGEEVQGMVLEDPFNEYEADGINLQDIEKEMQSMDLLIQKESVAIRGEFKFMNREINENFPALKSYSFQDVPMILLVAGNDRPVNWERNLIKLYESKIHQLSETRLIVLPQSPHYIHDFDPALVAESIRRAVFPDALKVLRNSLMTKGADSCFVLYKKLKITYPTEYILERFLNTLGYEELGREHISAAIKLFKLNVETFPNSSNVYDSLGEAYMKAGNKGEAIKNYQKSLELNPANMNARKMLEKINRN